MQVAKPIRKGRVSQYVYPGHQFKDTRTHVLEICSPLSHSISSRHNATFIIDPRIFFLSMKSELTSLSVLSR